MNDFTASNNVTVAHLTHADVWTVDPAALKGPFSRLNTDQVQALREFFQAEADERLGRWRWPDNPDISVRQINDRIVGVLRETEEGRAYGQFGRNDHTSCDPMSRAARAYFDAHPEPKPWHDAAAGEVWLLTIDREADVPSVASASEGGHVVFTAATGDAGGIEEIAPESKYITAGRRIWPEVS